MQDQRDLLDEAFISWVHYDLSRLKRKYPALGAVLETIICERIDQAKKEITNEKSKE